MKWLVDLLKKWFPTPEPSPLAKQVREAREFLGLNLQETSKMLGLAEDELRKFEAGL